jgi:molecular chaperone DnaJ
MSKRDYYDVLGVDKNADQPTIKSAFRKLAKQYHPDVSKEENAEAKFKEVQEAYEVLSDSQKRQQYDTFGHQANNGQGFSGSGLILISMIYSQVSLVEEDHKIQIVLEKDKIFNVV